MKQTAFMQAGLGGYAVNVAMDKTARTALLENILIDLGFKSNNRTWPFKEDGRRMTATLHAHKLWDALEIEDWDEEQGITN